MSLLVALAFAGCSQGIHSVSGGSPVTSSPAPVVISSSAQVVKVTSSPFSIPVNGSGDAVVTLSISPGYHINANPATFPYLIATEVTHTIDPDEGLPFMGKPVYPTPVTKTFAFAEQPLAVYEGEITISLPLRSPKPGECYACYKTGARLSFPIEVRVQACDSEKCFAPDTLKTIIAIDVK